MSQPEYRWRQLTPRQREELLAWRKSREHPWHSPPHRPNFGHLRFHVTAACFEHQPHIGHSPERMDACARDLLAVFTAHASQTFAWCVMPNHYHALVKLAGALPCFDLALLAQAFDDRRESGRAAVNGDNNDHNTILHIPSPPGHPGVCQLDLQRHEARAQCAGD